MDDVKASLQGALRKFPAAVTVISARRPDGMLLALTATAVTVLTLDPPTMIGCVNRKSAFAAGLDGVDAFCINVLTEAQMEVSAACAGAVPQGERDRVAAWRDGPYAVPVLADAQTSIICRKHEITVPGSHALLLGEVIAVEVAETVRPLIYLDRAYGGFSRL